MVKSGMVFICDGKTAETLNYLPKLDLWVCRYCDGSNLVFLFTKEIEERTKKDMKLEYKFYEKNLAPKWLEGDYDLHIEGNRMTMTSKDEKKVEIRCHPEDDWRLQIGIDELKERMNEVKKPREIKVGDKVKLKRSDCYSAKIVTDFFRDCEIPIEDVINVVDINTKGYYPSAVIPHTVKYIGYHTNVIDKKKYKVALVQSNGVGAEYVTDYTNLELVL